MLVLSRKIHEQILIPGLDIRLTILSVGKNRVQLGIEAPKGVQITRPESIRRSLEVHEQQVFEVECAGLAAISNV
ncbi:MAG: carbon storage regulator [Planctomycetaceae bacterium]